MKNVIEDIVIQGDLESYVGGSLPRLKDNILDHIGMQPLWGLELQIEAILTELRPRPPRPARLPRPPHKNEQVPLGNENLGPIV